MKTTTKIRTLLIILVPLLFCISLINYSATDDPRVAKILRQFDLFKTKFSQQKVYLHTDKDTYMAGETMWIKAYLVDASSLLPDTMSKDIHVELININSQSAHSIILKNHQGFSSGDIAIKDTLLEGIYQLRAYTKWMRNFNSDYLFFKTITIKNPNYENVITKSKLKDIKQLNRDILSKEKENTVTFFPEGGMLVAGLPGNVAFKAENGVGDGLKIKGTVFDNKGNQVVSFQSIHDGIGSFRFTPQSGIKYNAQVTYENGKTEKLSMPQTSPKGVVMSVDPSGEKSIRVLIQSNLPASEKNTSNEVIIVGQARGVITYVSKGVVKDKPALSIISKKLFPPGIAQITLFDGNGLPICERLVFINAPLESIDNQIKLTSSTVGDSVLLNVKLTQPNGNPLNGNFSLTVVENLSNSISQGNENILTNLLLTSDLRGRINNPSYYFDKNNPEANKHLDLLMLSHGWRRFVWKDIMDNRFPAISYPKDGGLSISGNVTPDFSEGSTSKSEVVLSVLSKYNDKFVTTTNSKGKFEFTMMDYEDTIKLKVETIKTNGGKPDLISIGDTLSPIIAIKPFAYTYNELYDKNKFQVNQHNENLENKKKGKVKSDEDVSGRNYTNPTHVLMIGKDINGYTSILQYMQGRIPGVEVRGNQVIIRGINSFMGPTDPLFVLDGVTTDISSISSINPSDVERIEILKGSDATIYGSRGANGVVLLYSKRNHMVKRGAIEFSLVGYHKEREFYTPPYESWNYKPENYNIPKTIYWKPYVITNSAGEATVRYKKKFASEKFTTSLEGITSSGEIICTKIQN